MFLIFHTKYSLQQFYKIVKPKGGENMNNTKEQILLYSTDDVCRILHIGKQKCLKLFHSEGFPSIKIGRKFWVKADCFDEYLSQKRMLSA